MRQPCIEEPSRFGRKGWAGTSAVATGLNNLGQIYAAKHAYGEAESMTQRAVGIWEKALGPDHPELATPLKNLATVYHLQSRYAAAEPLYHRALAYSRKTPGRARKRRKSWPLSLTYIVSSAATRKPSRCMSADSDSGNAAGTRG